MSVFYLGVLFENGNFLDTLYIQIYISYIIDLNQISF